MSRLSSEESGSEGAERDGSGDAEGEVVCRRCKGKGFRIKMVGRRQVMECVDCGEAV